MARFKSPLNRQAGKPVKSGSGFFISLIPSDQLKRIL